MYSLYIHTYMHNTYTHIYIYIYIYVCMYVCIYVCMYVCMYVCILYIYIVFYCPGQVIQKIARAIPTHQLETTIFTQQSTPTINKSLYLFVSVLARCVGMPRQNQ